MSNTTIYSITYYLLFFCCCCFWSITTMPPIIYLFYTDWLRICREPLVKIFHRIPFELIGQVWYFYTHSQQLQVTLFRTLFASDPESFQTNSRVILGLNKSEEKSVKLLTDLNISCSLPRAPYRASLAQPSGDSFQRTVTLQCEWQCRHVPAFSNRFIDHESARGLWEYLR